MKSNGIERRVIDSWAILSWLKEVPRAADAMDRLLEESGKSRVELMISQINLGEIFYILAKDKGMEAAEDFLDAFPSMPIRSLPVSKPLVLAAARVKAQNPISYADAFAVATARRNHASLVTGDPDLRRFMGGNVVRIDWIGT